MWQPIGTAPKDGTPVLIWDSGRLHEARWEPMRWNREDDDMTGAWAIRWAEIDSYGVTPDEPTHWMPLPDPPLK